MRGELALAQGHGDAAIRGWHRALELDGTNGDVPLSLADGYSDRRDYTQAHLLYQRAQTLPAVKKALLRTACRSLKHFNDERIAHLHTLIVVVGKDGERLPQRLAESLTVSFRGGDWPHVPCRRRPSVA